MTAQQIAWHPIARPELVFPLRKNLRLMLADGNVVTGKYSVVNHCFLTTAGECVAPVAYSEEDFDTPSSVTAKS